MSELNGISIENLRVRARRAKALAMEKHKAGDLAGAKKYAVMARKLNPYLNGLLRLNAVLDVLHGFEQKIDGEVDWYAVLGVDLTADVATIQERNRKLLLFILMDDSDDSVCSVDEVKMILADCWRSFCDEDNKKLYDKRRQERVDYVKQQQLKRASQAGPSFTSNTVTLSAPNPPQRAGKENERMVHPPMRMSGKVPMSTATPVTLSASTPPGFVSKKNKRMVQPPVRVSSQVPMSSATPVTLSVSPPPGFVSKENKRMVQPPVRVSSQVPMSTAATPVTLSVSTPPGFVSKKDKRMVQPPVRVSSQVLMSTATPVTFSASTPPPPGFVSKENKRMVQPPVPRVSSQVPMSTATPVTSLAFNPPQNLTKEKVIVSGKVPLFTISPVILSPSSPSQKPNMSASFKNLKGLFEVKVGKHDQLPSRISVGDLRRATQVPSLSVPKPVAKSRRLKTFDEELEGLVEVNVELFVQPSLPVSSPPRRGSEGESKRRAPTDMLHENKSRRINEDAGIRSIERGGDNVVPRAIKSSLQRFLSACQRKNFASSSSSAAIPPQESKKFNAPNSVNTESTKKLVTAGQCSKGVYPKKGDVWAIYENWSPYWDVSTPKEVVNKYEMVQVLEGFDEVRGVTVAPLFKVPGFKAIVFRRLPIPRIFSKKELVRFSQKVASRLFKSQEGKNAPKGCLELDPASMSPELLQVFTEELKSSKNQ